MNYVARVNDKYLTDEDFSKKHESKRLNKLAKDELVNSWVEKEVLFQEAKSQGLENDTLVNELLEIQKKEIIVARYLETVLDEQKIVVNETDLNKYFERYHEDFQLQNDAFIINKISFKERNIAEKFRSILIESNWQSAVNVFRSEASLVNVETNLLLEKHKIQFPKIKRSLNNLLTNETSIVLEPEQNKFIIVQLVANLRKGKVPKLEHIYELVESRFIISKRNEFLRKHIRELKKNNLVEIKR